MRVYHSLVTFTPLFDTAAVGSKELNNKHSKSVCTTNVH